MDYSQVLEHLLEADTPINSSVLYNLSKLEPEEQERLFAIWAAIPVDRREDLLRELIEISEQNFEVDFEAVFRWGLSDSEWQVRAASVEGLWENEELALMDRLLQMVKDDPSTAVRAAAALALGRFLLLWELGKLPVQRCQPVYDVLRDIVLKAGEDLDVRRRALESLAYVTNDEVVAIIREAYDHPQEKMRISAVFGMGRSADERWIGTVMGELFSVNPEMRYEAARACGELQARAAVPRLAQLLEDPDHEVQEATIWALGQVGGDQAKRLLERCVDEGDDATRDAAEAALQELEFLYGQLDLPFHAFDDVESDSSS